MSEPNDSAHVLLIGAGRMGIDYAKILKHQEVNFKVIGRSESGAEKFRAATGIHAEIGGIQSYLSRSKKSTNPVTAIVCVTTSETPDTVELLLEAHTSGRLCISGMLIEKPLAPDVETAVLVAKKLSSTSIPAFIAFNRRFYPAVQNLKKLIDEDGGAEYIHFEFNEWEERFERAASVFQIEDRVIDNWQFTNGCHVVDTAFYLAGGLPIHVDSISSGGKCPRPFNSKLPETAIFGGSAITTHSTVITWKTYFRHKAPWMIEVVTSNKVKYQLNPLEKLIRIRPDCTQPELILSQAVTDVRPGISDMVSAFFDVLNDPSTVIRFPELIDAHMYEFLLEKVHKKICLPVKSHAVVIGGGNISHRYIQGLLSAQNSPYLHVSEPSGHQREHLTSKLISENPLTAQSVCVFEKPTAQWLPTRADLILSATTAGARFDSVMQILSQIHEVGCVILEKPTFQRLHHFDDFLQYAQARKIQAYSAAGGSTLFSEPIKSLVKWKRNNEAIITVRTVGHNWGLCCNSLHLFAQFAIVNKMRAGIDIGTSGEYSLKTQLQGVKASKRTGCVEVVSGTIELVHNASGLVVVELCCAEGRGDKIIRVDEYESQGIHVRYTPGDSYAALTIDGNTQSLEVSIARTSQIGPVLLQEIRSNNGHVTSLLSLDAVATFEMALLTVFDAHFSSCGIDTSKGVPIS